MQIDTLRLKCSVMSCAFWYLLFFNMGRIEITNSFLISTKPWCLGGGGQEFSISAERLILKQTGFNYYVLEIFLYCVY